MAARRKIKRAKKSRLKHPEMYTFVVVIGLIMYAVLVWYLYRSKHKRTVPTEQYDQIYDPLSLVSRTQIQTLLPEVDESVIFAPEVSHVTDRTLLVFVQSDYSNTERRQLIRHTWGQGRCYGNADNNDSNGDKGRNVVVIFAVGLRKEDDEDMESSLDLEMSEHNDILLLNIVDLYDSLTVKGLLTMTWIYENLPHVNYVIKTDDDVFLNIYAWLNAVQVVDRRNVTCLIAGFVWTNPKVERTGKYAVGKTAYKPKLYPSFCCGAGYIMSRHSIAAILEASSYIPLLVRDDPYFTGILAQAMDVSLFSFPEKTIRFTDRLSVQDLYRRPTMAVHGLGTRQWYRLWNGLQGRRRRRHQHHVTIRSIYQDEKGLRLLKLSHVLGKKLKNECPPEPTIRVSFPA